MLSHTMHASLLNEKAGALAGERVGSWVCPACVDGLTDRSSFWLAAGAWRLPAAWLAGWRWASWVGWPWGLAGWLGRLTTYSYSDSLV